MLALPALVAGGALLWSAMALAQGRPATPTLPVTPVTPATPSATAPLAVPRVAGVAIAGRVDVDSTRIVKLFDVSKGSSYDARGIQSGLKRLWGTGLFDDLQVTGRTDSAGVWLTLRVAERPHVAAIDWTGLHQFKAEDLNKHIGFEPGAPGRAARRQLGQGARRLQ
jgi:outer membrane protein assembly factor BamA